MSEMINNTELRQSLLKDLIKKLHAGEDVETVKEAFKANFSEVSTLEISQMEQALMKEGLALEEVQRLCDVHASLFDGSISDIHPQKDVTKVSGHPLNVFLAENERLVRLIEEEIRPFIGKVGNMPLLMLRVGIDRLAEIHHHYARKEYLFFPYLEKNGIDGPPKVMWGVDDEIRQDIKDLQASLSDPSSDLSVAFTKTEEVIKKVEDMIFKENNILVPLISETLSLFDFIQIDEASQEMGYFLEKPKDSWKVLTEEEKAQKHEEEYTGKVRFDAGEMWPEEINALLNVLPFDMTFVDKEGYVRYFTQGKERIFERPLTVLGRHVSLCHPPHSVHIVETIVESFRTGAKDNEDFWIPFKGMFVHIRYFAVRNKKGEYLGTLEVTQDIQPLRDLTGQKRLVSA